MLALIGAVLLGLRAFGVGENDPDLFYLGLAFGLAEVAIRIPVPVVGRKHQ